jgi:DNA-binding beta-propeller fold protein YncE
MLSKSLFLCFVCLPVWAQNPDTAGPDAQAAELRAMVQQAHRLPMRQSELKIQPPDADFGIGYPSSVAMARNGLIYVLQRSEEPGRPPVRGKADPVIVVNREGKILRSWGKGLFKIPHSIRVDPAGNIWTVDASSSLVMKFTPQGEKLMEISVGGQPETKSGFNGTTDIAFAPNGHLFISDGYGNARILEYTVDGKRLREWGSAGTGPGQFRQPHGIAVDEDGIVYVADRQNGRLQRFDLTGKYLGEWANLGMVTTVAMSGGTLWIGTQQRNEPTGGPGWIMKIDRRTGKILGYVDSAHGHHVVNVARSGDLLSGARPDKVLWFHASK